MVFDSTVASGEESTNTIDSMTNSALDYMQRFANRLKQKTGHIRGQVGKLMSDHIEVIRAKLEAGKK